MGVEKEHAGIVRFGVFEVDLRARELRKQSRRIRLQDQPFLVLTALIQRPGEVVTREELRTMIWSEDTFVDFDNGLNTAINKLREALGDSANCPRFIETLPRRGYRFLGAATTDGAKKPVSSPLSRKVILWATVTVLIGAAAIGGWLRRSSRSRVLTEKDTIVLGDFANSTGDPVFDGTLRAGLSVELEQSPILNLLSEDQIRETLRMMSQKPDARLTPEIAQEVCQRTNSTAALEGSINLIGTRYNMILRAIRCAGGSVLASAEGQANDKSHVLDTLGKVASEMRRKLGESLSTLQTYNTPLERATTPSLEALQAYSLGAEAEDGGENAAALSFFQRAVRLDPNFATAHDEMGNMYGVMGETVLAGREIERAFELRAGLSDWERLGIEADYYISRTGDLIKARQVCEQGKKLYAGSAKQSQVWFQAELGEISRALGQRAMGLEESVQALHLRPNTDALLYRGVLRSYLSLDRVGEAAALAGEARAKGLDAHLGGVLYGLAFYRDDSDGMAREVARVTGMPGEEDLLLAMDADTAAYFGQLEKARERTRRAADSAGLSAEKETAAGYHAVAALREALFGNEANARQQAALANGGSNGRDAEYGVALALAYARRDSQALVSADDLEKKFPEDTIVQFNYLPTLRAKLALDHSNPRLALELLLASTPFELGLPSGSYYNWPNLYPVYVRGEAYLAARQGGEAAVEFQKILGHRGIILNEPIGVLAHLQLGRAYAMQGDTAKARAAYEGFLTLWKDADPDIPIFQQAKDEYAKLR